MAGEATSLNEIHMKSRRPYSGRLDNSYDELSAQIHESPRSFGLLTSRCTVVFNKKWPVTVLSEMLEANNLNVVRSFFESYGSENAAAMCFQLAAGSNYQSPSVSSPYW